MCGCVDQTATIIHVKTVRCNKYWEPVLASIHLKSRKNDRNCAFIPYIYNAQTITQFYPYTSFVKSTEKCLRVSFCFFEQYFEEIFYPIYWNSKFKKKNKVIVERKWRCEIFPMTRYAKTFFLTKWICFEISKYHFTLMSFIASDLPEQFLFCKWYYSVLSTLFILHRRFGE